MEKFWKYEPSSHPTACLQYLSFYLHSTSVEVKEKNYFDVLIFVLSTIEILTEFNSPGWKDINIKRKYT